MGEFPRLELSLRLKLSLQVPVSITALTPVMKRGKKKQGSLKLRLPVDVPGEDVLELLRERGHKGPHGLKTFSLLFS